MELLLLHVIILVWLSVAAAYRWTEQPADHLLATCAIAWANLIATELLLSPVGMLGEPGAFLTCSIGIALLLGAISWQTGRKPAPHGAVATQSQFWHAAIILTLCLISLACAVVAANYPPLDEKAITDMLPRALLMVGDGSILPLQEGSARQALLPFNHGLIQVAALVYHPSLLCLNFINLLGWITTGVGVNQVCRRLGIGPKAALAATWCALLATPVLAQAAGTGDILPAAAALITAYSFILDWIERGRTASAALAGLAAGLAAGSHPGMMVILGLVLISSLKHRLRWRNLLYAALPCFLLGVLPLAGSLALTVWKHPLGLIAALPLSTEGRWNLPLSVLVPLWRRPQLLDPLTEHDISLGMSGLACLGAGAASAWRMRLGHREVASLAALSVAWMVVALITSRWLYCGSEQLVPVVLLACPSLALLLERIPPGSRWSAWICLGVLGLGSLHSALLYLCFNTTRPLAPLIVPSKAQTPPSELTPELALRLLKPRRVNFITDTEQEPLLLLMRYHENQRYTAVSRSLPAAYNVVSRASLARNRNLSGLGSEGSYVWVPFPTKPTAGIEPLGSMGRGGAARDYFGISGQSDSEAPIEGNRAILVSIVPVRSVDEGDRLRVSALGLNPKDRAQLHVLVEEPAGTRHRIATMIDEKPVIISPPSEYYRLLFQIVAEADGRELNIVGLPLHRAPMLVASTAPPLSNPALTFSADLVTAVGPSQIACEGLQPPEGPYPQWNLPRLRWSRVPAVTLRVPSIPDLAKIRLSLSVRTHIRPKATLEVLGNGALLKHVEFSDPNDWQAITVDVPCRPMENVIVLRDAPLPPLPDWSDYLQRYPDVRSYLERVHQPLREGAIEHYNYSGKSEGRVMHYIAPEPLPPDSYRYMYRTIRLEGLRQ